MVRLSQSMHLSCTDTNTVSKSKEERFPITHVTKVFHRVRLKRFMSLWYVQRKLCTNLGSRLALSPNRPSFHLSLVTLVYHRVPSKWFLSRWYVWRKLCTYLAPTPTLNPNRKKIPHEPRHLGVPSCVSKMISELMVCSTQTVHLSYIKVSTIFDTTETTKTWALSPSGAIRCVENYI
jgi:hypothetical protein